MPRPRFGRLDVAKQERILDAAAREFARFGYEGASVNRILDSVGLSKGAFYYYFDDKADLAAAVLMWAYRDILAMYDRIEVPEDGEKFWDAIRQYAHESLAMLERAPYANELAPRLSLAVANDKELSARVMQAAAKPWAVIAAVWKRGQELGAVRSDIPIQTQIAIYQAIKEALIRSYLPDGRVPTREEFERLVELQIDLFRRVSAPASEVVR
jgi:AcrR family transcriptional regulator